MNHWKKTIDSPLGPIELVRSPRGLSGLYLSTDPRFGRAEAEPGSEGFEEVEGQLQAYFRGARSEFRLPLDPQGTAFQRAVWQALTEIPFGQTRSYGALAAALGRPSASRAVGAANGKNPIAIIVPCHRVIGGSGQLTGYAGGLSAKAWLLEHEHERTQPRPTFSNLQAPVL